MLEFWARNPHFFIYKILPGTLAPVIILLAMNWNLNNAIQMGENDDIAVIIKLFTVGLVLFIVAAQGILFAGNQFGFEGENIRTILALPTPRQHLLTGKNIFLGGLFIIDAMVMSLALLVYFPTLYAFFSWLTLLVVMFLLILAFGNFTSSIWPYWMPLDKPSFTLRTTVILGFVNMGFTIVLAVAILPAIAMIVIPYNTGHQWLGYILMPVAVGYGCFIHKITLKPAVALFESNEFLVLRRVADREQL
jgi:MFS family permease